MSTFYRDEDTYRRNKQYCNDIVAITSKDCALVAKSWSMTPNFRVGPECGLLPHTMRSSRVADAAQTEGYQDITVPSSDHTVPRIEPLYPVIPKFVHKETNKFPVSCPGVEMVLRKWTDAKASGQKSRGLTKMNVYSQVSLNDGGYVLRNKT
jgi:hypothetical protein